MKNCKHEHAKFLGGHEIGKVAYLCQDCGAIVSKDYKSLPYPYPGMVGEKIVSLRVDEKWSVKPV